MNKRLLVVAGGTGGHIFPGIAVANELAAKGWDVSWVGTADRMEARVVPKHGYEIDFIKVQGLRGNGLKRLLVAPYRILKAIVCAKRIIKQRQPHIVLAMGGYVTGPVGLAAKIAGVPLVIHEQNAVAGLSNKLLAKVADSVLCAFPDAFPNSRHLIVGNPVRQSVTQLNPQPIKEQIKCLVIGGSLGAKILNDILPEVFNSLASKQNLSIAVTHQTGKGHADEVLSHYNTLDFNAEVVEFIDDIDKAYAWADIVICRAGALTVSEIAAAGKMAVFVPYAHAVDDHQTANAQYLVTEQAALLIPQSNFNVQSTIDVLLPYFKQPEKIHAMAKKAKKRAKLNATSDVASICQKLSKE